MATESIYRLDKLSRKESAQFGKALEEAYELRKKHPYKKNPRLKTLTGEEARQAILRMRKNKNNHE